MANSWLNLEEKGIQKVKCKDSDFTQFVKDNWIKYKCLSCIQDYSNKPDKLKKWFKNTLKFSNNGINKFILLLRKGVYPYEYMDELEKINETSLPVKEEFHINLTMGDIIYTDYMHAKKVCKTLGEFHDLYPKSDALLLADVFENFKKMYLEVCQQDPAKYFSAAGLAWQATLKNTKVARTRTINRHGYVANSWKSK